MPGFTKQCLVSVLSDVLFFVSWFTNPPTRYFLFLKENFAFLAWRILT